MPALAAESEAAPLHDHRRSPGGIDRPETRARDDTCVSAPGIIAV
jgi:hypothetical protein